MAAGSAAHGERLRRRRGGRLAAAARGAVHVFAGRTGKGDVWVKATANAVVIVLNHAASKLVVFRQGNGESQGFCWRWQVMDANCLSQPPIASVATAACEMEESVV